MNYEHNTTTYFNLQRKTRSQKTLLSPGKQLEKLNNVETKRFFN